VAQDSRGVLRNFFIILVMHLSKLNTLHQGSNSREGGGLNQAALHSGVFEDPMNVFRHDCSPIFDPPPKQIGDDLTLF
jgi:hypothetical protein